VSTAYVSAIQLRLYILSFLSLIAAGCVSQPATPLTAEYYLIGIPECTEIDLVSDLHIIKCASRVEAAFRQRYNNARLARTEGGLLQVITAGASSLITGLGGANGVTAGTILSGISAMMPEVSNVVEAKDRAEAYADGMKSIGTALGVYRKTSVETSDGTINPFRTTAAGATLHVTLRAAINVVEARLAALLPSTDELKKARSEIDRFERVEVIPSTLSLPATGTSATLAIVNGSQIRAASSNDNVATVSEVVNSGGTRFLITATAKPCDWTNITLANSGGGRETVPVRIEPAAVFSIAVPNITVSQKASPVTVNKLITQGCPLKAVKSDDAKIANVSLVDGQSILITAVAIGETMLRLENQSGRTAHIKTVVTP
jgi:hypothetical protein